eukprot:985272-Prymnesium_polylepis.1
MQASGDAEEAAEDWVDLDMLRPAVLETSDLLAGYSGGGGVRAKPPFLLAPLDQLDAEEAALESLAVLESAPLAAGPSGGGGVRAPPPRLLGLLEDEAEEEEAAVEVGR